MPQDGDGAVSLQEVRDKSREMDLEIAEQMGHPGTGIADMARQAVSDIDQQVGLGIPSYFWNQVLNIRVEVWTPIFRRKADSNHILTGER